MLPPLTHHDHHHPRVRNFGLPMNVEPVFKGESIWGYKVGIFKNGVKLTDIMVQVGEGTLSNNAWQ